MINNGNTSELFRSYKLKLIGTKLKMDNLEWSAYKYNELVNQFIPKLYFRNFIENEVGKNGKVKEFFSTEGLGQLGNQAQQKAIGIVKSKHKNEKMNDHKKSIPFFKPLCCFANISISESKHFDYAIHFRVSFGKERSKASYIFARRTTPLKKALKNNWVMSDQCEIIKEKDGNWYVLVFVKKQISLNNIPNEKSIGIDVGINHIVATSDGYLGNSISKRMKREQESQSERSRQKNLTERKLKKDKENIYLQNKVEKLVKDCKKNKNKIKSKIKQLLDVEAKKLICRAVKSKCNLVVEDPLVLANLTKINKWARTYLAHRLETLGAENNVFVVRVHPRYTSVTCPYCLSSKKDGKELIYRKGKVFKCLNPHCDHYSVMLHADLNAAYNISIRGQESVDKFIKPSILNRISKSLKLNNTVKPLS